MTNEVKNVPELRFPNFEGEWEEKKLGDLVSIISGYSPSYYSIGGEYPLYKVNDLNNNNKYQIYSELYVSKKGEPTSNKTIIFPKRGAAILLNKIRIMITPGYIDTNLMGLQFEDINNTEFYYYTILKEGLFKIADTSTIPQINNKHILNYKINLPDNSERNKLGDFFNKLDQQIELEEQKLEKLEEQKKGYMQQIFSQKLRFKDENNNDYPEWKEQKLYEVVKYLSSKRSSNNYSENIMQGDYPVYDAIQEISKDVNFDIKEPYISILKDGAGVGRLNLRPGKSSVIGTMGYLLPENIDINFLFYYLKTMNFNKFVIGSTIPHLYFKDYSKETIFVPKNEEEQFKIGSFFIKLDKVIENKSDKIELLKERKKGFLQRMFV